MGARLGTVPGWERISSSTDEPREYTGVGPTKIFYPKYGGVEIAEYWVRFDVDLNYCDSPPISPIVIRTLTNILIIQKFVDNPPNFQEWINEVTESEALDIYRMSIIEMGGLRECGDPDNYKITIKDNGKIEQPKPTQLEIEKLKEIQKRKDSQKEKDTDKIKQEKIEDKSKIEIIKKQVKIYKEMKKESNPPIPKEISEQMIKYYEEKEKELLKIQEKKKKDELRKIKQTEKERVKEKKKELKPLELGIPIYIKTELTTMDIVQISRINKSISKLEKQKEEQQKYLNITLAAIERIEESGKADFLLGHVVTRDRWLDEINLTNIKIGRQKEAIEKIQIGG